ncbi:MAG: 2-succinyl-5-enolpyruvyl-6-hydroxy-3-cyclohexene-1-carboxylic-acid synthase [Nocardioidaceae bacterium]|nr:2-succinyl-5-enolpyruvyl-6-hydroxy-3-cyclohexene-1-carboxylic-acid synthase [Nocardioidaceae bacterium]
MSSAAVDLAESVLERLLAAGVTDVVLAPGSRNAPLAYAAWRADRLGRLRLHTRIDERTAGFLALGLTRMGARAAVVCTSGTAVANLHPAALEAAHSGVPLVLLTADRPARLRGTGANQTTDQVGIFGRLVDTHDVASIDDIPPDLVGPTPLHLNVQLDAPLVPAELPARLTVGQLGRENCGLDDEPSSSRSQFHRPAGETVTRLAPGPRTIVIAGDDAGPAARRLAEAAGWPLVAEPSSGSRTGANALRTGRLLLTTPLAERVQRVVVLGRPNLSRPVGRVIERGDVETYVVPAAGVWPMSPAGATVATAPTWSADGPDDPAWLDEWREADRELGRRIDRYLAEQPALTPYDVAGAVARALPPGGLLVVGASNPIRDLDLMHRPTPVGERRMVVANRGLAGIDGTVSSAIGAALGRPHSTRALALMGDLTFLHDANGLLIGPDEPRPDLTIVVPNDDGGSIFATLEQGAEPLATAFERLFGTPHGTDLASLCAAHRVPHLRVTSRPELDHALAAPNGGIEVVEVVVGRHDRRALDEALRGLAQAQ